jgi:hypothetical protein
VHMAFSKGNALATSSRPDKHTWCAQLCCQSRWRHTWHLCQGSALQERQPHRPLQRPLVRRHDKTKSTPTFNPSTPPHARGFPWATASMLSTHHSTHQLVGVACRHTIRRCVQQPRTTVPPAVGLQHSCPVC